MCVCVCVLFRDMVIRVQIKKRMKRLLFHFALTKAIRIASYR